MRSTSADKGKVLDSRGASAVLTTPGLMARKMKPSSLRAAMKCHHETDNPCMKISVLTSIFDIDHLKSTLGDAVRGLPREARLKIEGRYPEAGGQGQDLLQCALPQERKESVRGQYRTHHIRRPAVVELLQQSCVVRAVSKNSVFFHE